MLKYDKMKKMKMNVKEMTYIYFPLNIDRLLLPLCNKLFFRRRGYCAQHF